MKKIVSVVYCLLLSNIGFVPLYYRQKAKNPLWLVMFIFSRFYFLRKVVTLFYKSKFIVSNNIVQNKTSDSIFEKTNVRNIVKSVEEIGFFQGLQLPQNYVDEILDFADKNECYAEDNFNRPFKLVPSKTKNSTDRNIMRGEYRHTFEKCPAIATIAQDSQIIAIATNYLKTKPVLMNTRLWWNFVVDEDSCDLRKGARTFHYDPDDYRCIAFAFYLTDVDAQSGSHVCVKGSHKRKKLKRLLSLDLNTPDREIVADYGQKNIVTIEGKSGYGFIEDKFVYHKASSPLNTKRLILYIQYGMNDYKSDRLKNMCL